MSFYVIRITFLVPEESEHDGAIESHRGERERFRAEPFWRALTDWAIQAMPPLTPMIWPLM